ncbi:hypothetical protein [Paenibacillus sp. FSL H7-0323]|uniref:hypothetical protein n=1 Tax=Paenibacillus sp. FSL H7-0323 TaxID=2921433 RepID=UPI0030FD028E
MWEHPSNSQVKQLKNKYKELYIQLEPIVNAWDPIGLIGGGAPKDEYDCITVQLISMLSKGRGQNDIYEFIIHELDDHFGMGIDSISSEYMERFIKKHKDFSANLVKWYTSQKI